MNGMETDDAKYNEGNEAAATKCVTSNDATNHWAKRCFLREVGQLSIIEGRHLSGKKYHVNHPQTN